MELCAEVKLMGDAYPGGFACGMSLGRSGTIGGFSKVSEEPEAIRYEDPRGLALVVHRQQDGEAQRVWTEFQNNSGEEVTLEMLASFALAEVKADAVYRMQSFWSAEGKLRRETICDLHLEPSWNRCSTRVERFGNLGSMPVRKYFPFLALEDSETGQVTAIQLYVGASWQMEISVKESDLLTVTGGLPDREVGHWTRKVAPGESFSAPPAVIAQGENLYQACARLTAAQHPAISPVDDHMGIVFNEYCTTWGNPTLENLKQIADRLEGKGVQFLVIDCGWYGQGDAWPQSVGDWDVNPERLPGGLKEAADYIRSKGMIPGLWFEMESVGPTSSHYEDAEHLVKRDGVPLTVGARRFWDMEDPWVVDYLSEKVIGQLKAGGFGYLKVDYNETMGLGVDGGDSLGDGLQRKVEASRRFFQKIREEVPGIVIENCSSGGHRLTPAFMELVSQASFSDAHETTAIPLIAANLHRVIRPEQSQIWAVMRVTDDDARLHYSLAATMLGRMCLSGDIHNLSDHQWQVVEEAIAFYRRAAEIIRDGVTVLHQVNTPGYNAPQGEQLVLRELGDRGLAVYHRFENSKDGMPPLPAGCRILESFGSADRDFSAQAWLYQRA
ncbi:MAG: glycoside hydrolase family 36 protein [Acutalibacter sp.]